MQEKLAQLLKLGLERWTAKSPKAYKIATNVALGVGIGAMLISAAPIVVPFVAIPAWVVSVSGFVSAVCFKMTVESNNP